MSAIASRARISTKRLIPCVNRCGFWWNIKKTGLVQRYTVPGNTEKPPFQDRNRAWFTKVAIWVAAPLTCFRARAHAQRSGTRNLDRREADYEYDYDYEHDFKRESCDPELNQARKPVRLYSADQRTEDESGGEAL